MKQLLMVTVLSLIVAPTGIVLSAQGQPKVASTTKSKRLEHKEYFDKKQTQLKLYYEYYELRSYDDNDTLLSSAEVYDGYYIEWNKKGKEQRMLRAKQDLGKGYLKLIRQYEEGKLTFTSDFHPSGKLKSEVEYDGSGRELSVKGWADTDQQGDGELIVHAETTYFDSGEVRETKRIERGKLVHEAKYREISYKDGNTVKKKHSPDFITDCEYYPSGTLKSRTSTYYTYGYSGLLDRTQVSKTTRTENGMETTTLDGIKTSEGKIAVIRKQELKDGEWNYWDPSGVLIRLENWKDGKREGDWKFWEAGKLTRVETWKDGKLQETREYK